MMFFIFCLVTLLPCTFASEEILHLTEITTAITTVTVSSQSEPMIPPAEWSTSYVTGFLSPDSIITSTLPTTATRTVAGHTSVVSVQTGTCGLSSSPEAGCTSLTGLHRPNTTLACYSTEQIITTYVTLTHHTCTYGSESSSSVTTISSLSAYSCDPRVNWSCLESSSSLTTESSFRDTTFTVAVDPTSHSATPCQQPSTSSPCAWTVISTSSASPQSRSSSISTSSTTTCSTLLSTSAPNTSHHPTSSSTSSPVIAGTNTLKPASVPLMIIAPMVIMLGHFWNIHIR